MTLLALIEQIGSNALPTKIKITVADGTLEKYRGRLRTFLAMFGYLKTKVDFLVVEDVPVKVLNGIPRVRTS